MDRPLDRNRQRRLVIRRVAIATLTAVVAAAGVRLGVASLRPTVARRDLRIAVVDVGPVESVVIAAGTVLPEVEQVFSMPVDARVLKIRKRTGDAIAAGEPILDLDLSAALLAREKLAQAVALRANQQDQARLGLSARLTEIAGLREMKTLQLDALRAQASLDRQLYERGHLSRASLAQSELQEAQVAVEVRRLAEDERTARESTRVAVRGLALEMTTLRQEREEAAKQLALATARTDRAGVVTWTVSEEGAAVRRGDVVARVADLRTFRIVATVSDVYAQRIASSMPVIIKVTDKDESTSIVGAVASVDPTVRDGVVTFSVSLANRSNPRLRSNLRVDVLVVTSHKARALRLARGPFTDGTGWHDVFVVRGDRIRRTRVQLGLAGADHFEIVDGLSDGDEAVVSDMTEYLHLPELALR